MEPESDAAGVVGRVEVLWRPGCRYCSRLRRGLARAGVSTVECDVWSDPEAAARVRAATGGDETVPTVVIGTRALVNPSAAQVVAVMRSELGEQAETLISAPAPGPGRSVVAAAMWAAVTGVVWVLLALWRPGTDWYLAPALLAAAPAWVIGQDLRAKDARGIVRLAGATVAGAAAAALVAVGLDRIGVLAGPAVLGMASRPGESVLLAVVGGLIAAAAGAVRLLRRPGAASAWVGEHRVAASQDVVRVEGNAYFPLTAVADGVLTASKTRTVCPWKGVARYYCVSVDGVDMPDAAWSYPHPLPLARRVKGRVAFWGGVDVRTE